MKDSRSVRVSRRPAVLLVKVAAWTLGATALATVLLFSVFSVVIVEVGDDAHAVVVTRYLTPCNVVLSDEVAGWRDRLSPRDGRVTIIKWAGLARQSAPLLEAYARPR